ncbi:MAG: hypothetical protein HZY77_01515 [Thiobacillus sp.]|uniref:hypothetical protein n=1 Tax=Thiobacillus sp. TaxID=924 RepID=UPI00168C57D0|nr:hypothetical protein [Thiobacillus sp.]QLQ01742.1 MAG: hypothetical protein HZY77_01515 [Thiobacillus sp.]
MKTAQLIPNRLGAKLTPEERLAERYIDQPARLLELAAETRNRALYQVARDMLRKPKRGEA